MKVSSEIKTLISDDLLAEAGRAGVKKISCSSWLYTIRRFFGFFDPGAKEIFLDLSTGEKLLALYQKKYPELNPAGPEVFIFLLLHEIGHALYGESESRAEEYARKRFIEWRGEAKKKLIKEIQEGITEGFKARGLL